MRPSCATSAELVISVSAITPSIPKLPTLCAMHAVAARARAAIRCKVVQTPVRLALQFSLLLAVGCGSEAPLDHDSAGGAASGSGGSASASSHAQLRFVYRTEWQEHLATCAWISEYRIKFGANPIPVSAPVEVTPDSMSEYVEVDGRTYEDSDVLHVFTCNKTQTSKQTLQVYGKFGRDLPLEPAKRYTVTLGGSAATLAEDP
jgi:hypothetical protein